MSGRGLPVGPPPPDLLDLPLNPLAEEPAFLRPRRRTRVRRARRGLSARLVLVLQLAGALFASAALLWTGYSRVMASERLKVGKVEVQGNHFLSEGEVREMLGPAVGENILGLDIETLKGRLRASPWVANAVVGRTLPDTIRVEVQERVPLALAEMDRLYLMDGDGGLIDIYGPRTAAFDLPIVRGLSGVEGEARRDRAQRAGALLRDLAELGAEISEVYVESTGDLKVVLRGPGEVLLLGDPPCRKRFSTFLALRKELAEKSPGVEYYDLRFRGRIYARAPEPKAPKPEVHPAPRPAPSPSPAAPATRAPGAAEPPPDGEQAQTPAEGEASVARAADPRSPAESPYRR